MIGATYLVGKKTQHLEVEYTTKNRKSIMKVEIFRDRFEGTETKY